MNGGRGLGRAPAVMTAEEKRNLPKITKGLVKRIFGWLLPYLPQLLLVTCTILAASVLDLLPALLAGRIIDDGFIGGNFNLLMVLIAASFAVLVISNLLGLLQSYLNTWVAQHITMDMRGGMYAHLQKMSHRFFTGSKQGEAITRMTSDIDGVQNVISGTLTSTISNIAVLATSVIAMYRVNWVLATVGIIIVPLFALPTKRVGKRRWALTLARQEKADEINQILNETLSVSGQQLVKLFNGEEKENAKYNAANEDMFRLSIKESMAGRWFRMAMNTFTSLGPMLIYFAGGILMLRMGYVTLTVGDITVMVALLSRMYRPVNNLLGIQVDFIRTMALFQRIFEYFDMPVEVDNAPDAIIPQGFTGDIKFENVDFHYNEGSPILKDVSFTVPKGRTVAIVGPSGSGKSTVTSLITRLYDVTGGKILLGGHDVRGLDLSFLRQNVGMVTQDSYLFNGTIKENLLYANENATQAEIEAACKEANIHSYIATLPNGYDTVVGNRGIKLSGGERQRLSIARVILKNPKILILDEATSALDSISESLIQQAIEPLLKGRTSIVIAHRLSTIISADEIIALENGQIAQQGSHASLLAQNGCYKRLYETQFERVLQQEMQSA